MGNKKYDETAAMIGLLKYGCGLPFVRLQRLGDDLGMPLPASTQWEVIKEAAEYLEPVWTELIHQAAQGSLVHIDDTKANVLHLSAEILEEIATGTNKRTGVFFLGGHLHG